jgi:5-methylcytosine-specific restriction protein A
MAKLCRCGKIVKDRCDCSSGQSVNRRNVTSEGHGQDHRLASERYRANHPLCERCVMLYGAMDAKPSKDMHHIHSIRSAPHLRMSPDNWLAVCGPCHEDIEGDAMQGMEIKRWSEHAYSEALEGSSGLKPGVSEKLGLTVADRSRSLPCGSPKLGVLG